MSNNKTQRNRISKSQRITCFMSWLKDLHKRNGAPKEKEPTKVQFIKHI